MVPVPLIRSLGKAFSDLIDSDFIDRHPLLIVSGIILLAVAFVIWVGGLSLQNVFP